MRSTWSFAAFAIVAGFTFAACAQSVADDGGIFDDDAGGPDPTLDADVGDVTHHDYGSHDSGAAGDTGGGSAGDGSSSVSDASASSDSSSTKDSGGGAHDSGAAADTGAPDTGPPPTGGTACGSNAKYIFESLAAALDPNAVVCSDGSECSTSQCCESGFCVAL